MGRELEGSPKAIPQTASEEKSEMDSSEVRKWG